MWDRLLAQKHIEKWDTFFVFYKILDKIVDNYFPLLYDIEDKLDEIEDNTQKKSMNQLMNELFDTRNMLLNLMHTVHPMRDLLYRMLNSEHLGSTKKEKHIFLIFTTTF